MIMQRYFIIDIKSTGCMNKKTGFIDFKIERYVVSTMGEAIGDNCFYRKRKWCGTDYFELYDTSTGVYICRKESLEELYKYVASDEFYNQLERTRNSYFYKLMLRTFNKAMKEYDERVKGGKEK